jgi:hypothetical protein
MDLGSRRRRWQIHGHHFRFRSPHSPVRNPHEVVEARLELIAQRKLQLARGRGVGNLPESVSIKGRVELIESDIVRKVVGLGTKLQSVTFHNPEVFLQRKVPVVTSRRTDYVCAGSAVSVLCR